MKTVNIWLKLESVFFVLIFILSNFCILPSGFAQEQAVPAAPQQPPQEQTPEKAEILDSLKASDNVTLDFKDADIHSVLKIMAQKGNINIVPTADVMGTVTIKLTDVPWERALDIVLKSNGFGFQKQGNVILVTKIENIAKIQSEEPLRTEVVDLKFLDAQDAMRILIPMLSSRGKIAILHTKGQKGWKFGSFQIGKQEVSARSLQREEEDSPRQEVISVGTNAAGAVQATKVEYQPAIKSKTLIITDTDASLDRIINTILPKIDRRPKQVLIEARIMEVNVDKLKDLGFDYATGSTGVTGVSSSTPGLTMTEAASNSAQTTTQTIGGRNLATEITPSVFGPKASGITGAEPFTTGLELIYQKLTGTEFQVVLHALEEDVNANTLSAPRIMTLDNQEASMLVGYHTPILKSAVSGGTDTESAKLTQTLDYYQEIGIRLNVVPQVSEEGYINMIIHPSITSSSTTVSADSISGNITATINYPVIEVRETQTQILMKDGETIVIGGLLKDVKARSIIGIPFLSKLPLIGVFFRRETVDTSKVDLMIFISAHVVKEDEFSPKEITRLEQRLGLTPKADAVEKKKKKK
jgi:type IV pilus assembly protein PilQ